MMKSSGLLAMLLALASPSLAQDGEKPEQPVVKKDENEGEGKEKPVTEKEARKVLKDFTEAMTAKDLEKALACFELPFLFFHGIVDKKDEASMKKYLLGRFGQRLTKKYAEQGDTIFWDDSDPRAQKAIKFAPALKGCVWIGKIYPNRLPTPRQAKKPLAFKRIKGKVKIVGFHDD